MTPGERGRIDRKIWVAIAMVACLVIASSAFSSFVIHWTSFVKPALVLSALLSASLFYRLVREDQPLAEALAGAAQLVAFASVAAPLSYVAASAAFPLWDMELAAWDHRLGFDWMAWLAFLNTIPLLHATMALAYASFAVQTTAVVIALGIAGRALHLRVFVLAFICTTLATIAVSTIIPAQGVWGYWHLSLSDSPTIVPMTRDLPLPVFFGLRDGTYRHLVAENAEGIISFPSLHAALGLLFIFALWPVKQVRWIALALNLVMIAATPVDGSHYICDVIAGLFLATLSWVAVRRLVSRYESGFPDAVKVTKVAPSFWPGLGGIFRVFGKASAQGLQ